MACAVLSYAAGLTTNFFLARHYVIGEPDRQLRSLPAQFAAYAATGLVSLAVVQILLLVFNVILEFDPFLVKIASVPVVFAWTVLSSRHLVFTKGPPPGALPSAGIAPSRQRSSRMPTDVERNAAPPRPETGRGAAEGAGAEPRPGSVAPPPPGAAGGGPGDGRWPKRVPELTPEQRAIRDEFMGSHLEAMETKWYGFVTGFDNRYPLRTFFPGCRTLEIGAGLGEHLNWERLAEQEYHAVELRQELCDRIRARFPGANAWIGDCQDRLDFEDGHFDRIIAIHVLEHLPDLPRALAEFRRLLKPGGLVSAVIPCEGAWAHRLARAVSERPRFERKYRQPYDWLIASEHLSRPKEIMEQLGLFFDVLNVRYYPLLVPVVNINLTIGLTLGKRGGANVVQR
jgi:SAM-dependent methyltransferase